LFRNTGGVTRRALMRIYENVDVDFKAPRAHLPAVPSAFFRSSAAALVPHLHFLAHGLMACDRCGQGAAVSAVITEVLSTDKSVIAATGTAITLTEVTIADGEGR
jgi:hypothetical protein